MTVAGTIEFLLYDHLTGRISGVFLSDGSQVRLPPDVNDEFRKNLKVHEDVRVEGYGVLTPYGRTLEALAMGRKGEPLNYLDASSRQLTR
jgi:hypothetical protein